MEKIVIIILQNTEKVSKRKSASKKKSAPHKLTQYMRQRLLILDNLL